MTSVGFREPERPVKAAINFATPVGSVEDDEDEYYEDDLDQRIEDFKFHNPEDVEELKRCIHDVLGEAERIAQERLDKRIVSLFSLIIY